MLMGSTGANHRPHDAAECSEWNKVLRTEGERVRAVADHDDVLNVHVAGRFDRAYPRASV